MVEVSYKKRSRNEGDIGGGLRRGIGDLVFLQDEITLLSD